MNAPAHFARELLDEIRERISLEQLVGRRVKLHRVGRGFGGLCPFHNEKSPSFTVSDDKGFYHCFGCGAHGDAIDFVLATEGGTFADAVRRLADQGLLAVPRRYDPPPAATARDRGGSKELVSPEAVGRWLWRNSVPARGELVEAWLRARGLDPHGLDALGDGAGIDALRFHPDAPYFQWRVHEAPGTCWLSAPAMIAGMRDADGHVRGVHVTYLSADGRSKAVFPRTRDGKSLQARKMWGRLTGNAVWLAGSPTGDRAGKLLVGEGIETVWSVAQALVANGQRIRAAAALSLDNLQGHPLRDAQRALPLWNPMADFDRAMFAIRDPGHVVVLVDADMKPQEHLVQDTRSARRIRRHLSGLERAELCGSLAAQQWRHAGASAVSAVRPRLGLDFNDAVRGAP